MSRSKDRPLSQGASFAPRQLAIAGVLATAASVTTLTPAVLAESSAIPPLASADYGWQSNVEDWQAPPAGLGHGPISFDPAHPFISNAEGGRTHTQPTRRISNVKDPVP